MQITVHLRSDAARGLAERSPPSTEINELRQILSRLGITLRPLHPESTDPELRTQFWIDAPDQATADQIIQQLQPLRAVQAAYSKPPDEMP
ncbi:MAG: hypothetical protein JST84_16295 [Acidobacteria bacterium]|nr:hypothetical protein [Acidobacteriota bacterium]